MWIPPSFLDDAHSAFPDVFILSTEACAGFGADGKGVLLGSWERGEEYGHFIMQVKAIIFRLCSFHLTLTAHEKFYLTVF